MTHDPWELHSALSCPACHVTGKVVRFEREDGGYQCCDDEHIDDVDPYVCVECGQTWADTGVVGDVKDYRVAYGRLIEGRPYEEKIRKLVAEMQKGAEMPDRIPVHPSQYEALGITAPSSVYMSPPLPPAGSELETVDVDEASGVITYRYVKK
jgi:hypothetical protein